MDLDDKINPNPEIFEAVRLKREDEDDEAADDDDKPEPFDGQEIYDLIRDISDPEVRETDARQLASCASRTPHQYPSPD